MESDAGQAFAALFTLLGMSCLCLVPPALVLLIALFMSRDTNRRVAALEQQLAVLNAGLAMPAPPPPAPPPVDWPAAPDYQRPEGEMDGP